MSRSSAHEEAASAVVLNLSEPCCVTLPPAAVLHHCFSDSEHFFLLLLEQDNRESFCPGWDQSFHRWRPPSQASPWAAGSPAAQRAGLAQPRPGPPPAPAACRASTAGEPRFTSESFQLTRQWTLKSVKESFSYATIHFLLKEGARATSQIWGGEGEKVSVKNSNYRFDSKEKKIFINVLKLQLHRWFNNLICVPVICSLVHKDEL